MEAAETRAQGSAAVELNQNHCVIAHAERVRARAWLRVSVDGDGKADPKASVAQINPVHSGSRDREGDRLRFGARLRVGVRHGLRE